MLTLTRKLGETIHVGDGVVVKVTKIGINAVKLAVLAPLNVPILRGELKYPEGEPDFYVRKDQDQTPVKTTVDP